MLDETRLELLISAYFDRTLDPAGKAELEHMLLASARAREIFHDRAKWHGLTREWALRSHTAQFSALGETSTPPAPAPESRRIVRFPFNRRAAIGWAAAAAIALTWLVVRIVGPSTPEETVVVVDEEKVIQRVRGPREVAMLAEAVDVQWSEGSPAPTVGSALPRGWLRFDSGMLRLDFYSGAHVVLEGPAAIELLEPDEARLERGKLTARVTPPAIGFTVHNDAVKVVDRGTEFGMNVAGPGLCEVHVFEGEVALLGGILQTGEKLLFGGDGISIASGKWNPIRSNRGSFVDPGVLRDAVVRLTQAQWNRWKTFREKFRGTKDLKVYFDFQKFDPDTQVLPNNSVADGRFGPGTVIGCEPCPGRWPQKSALGFAKTSDRVRFRSEGTSPAITLMAWVRVDSLPQDHNALLSMSPDQKGEVHWKIDNSGRVLIGVRAEARVGRNTWERLASPPVVGAREFGHWMHLATVVDSETLTMRHYVNGREVASGPMKRPAEIQFGMADIGNYGSRNETMQIEDGIREIRNFSGRIDEFAMLARALSPEEIREAASQ